MLGHASVLARTEDACVLFDPLLYGEHHEGLYDVYPRRSLDTQKLPPLDAVVVSHAHLDHFDLPSLALVPRATPMLIADDREIESCLHGLGFHHVHKATNGSPVEVGDLTVTPTPAAVGAPEHGFLLQCGGTTIWNLVDTFPELSTIDRLMEEIGSVDLLIAPWQPLHDTGAVSGVAPHFPHAMYDRILRMIARIQPKALVPGACGFSACGAAAWQNHTMFPQSREAFMRDVQQLCPELETIIPLEPGDAISVTERGISIERELVASISDCEPYRWEERAFEPLANLGAPLREREEAATLEACEPAVRALVEEELPSFVGDHLRQFREHARWGVVQQLDVCFFDGRTRSWTLEFSESGLRVEAGASPLRQGFVQVTASLLIGLVAGTTSWAFAELSGDLRRYDFTYTIGPRGLEVPRIHLQDPLSAMLSGADAREDFQAAAVERLNDHYRDALTRMGLDPDEEMSTSTLEERESPALIDPTAVANSVMEQLRGSLDTKKGPQ
ncbi:MAG: MBL fold metallo-hydrolase [Myxococcota bacterium]